MIRRVKGQARLAAFWLTVCCSFSICGSWNNSSFLRNVSRSFLDSKICQWALCLCVWVSVHTIGSINLDETTPICFHQRKRVCACVCMLTQLHQLLWGRTGRLFTLLSSWQRFTTHTVWAISHLVEIKLPADSCFVWHGIIRLYKRINVSTFFYSPLWT